MTARIIHGDCVKVLPGLVRAGLLVDAAVMDPPYHLASIVARLGSPEAAPIQSGATGVYARSSQGFMGQQWDGGDVAFRASTWRRVYEIMKPGAHLIAFASTKGYHRMVCAIEDAGFEIRDMVLWLYGTGFPKSHNLEGDWDGWGTNLKPAVEPMVLAQKPISEDSIAANVARWGVGAFAGTGTTAVAAREAGIHSLSIEASADHVRDFGIRLGVPVAELLEASVGPLPCRHGPQEDMFL